MTTVDEVYYEAYVKGVIVGAIVMGALLGLIPFFIGRKGGHEKGGWISLALCVVGNFIGGIVLSIPICGICSFILWVKGRE